MRIDDWCCLGRTVPEESKKYGRKVCSVGYSEELRAFMRVYPLPIRSEISQRSVCRLELERNAGDGRNESWKLTRACEDQGITGVGAERKRADVLAWLDRNLSPSIASLNERKRSIGVLKIPADQVRGVFRSRNRTEAAEPEQGALFEDLDVHFGATISVAPYLEFSDPGGDHRIQVREWGCYEYLRKHPDNADGLWGAMRLDTPDADAYLVVGNMCNRRNVWLVISSYVEPRQTPVRGLFDDEPYETETPG